MKKYLISLEKDNKRRELFFSQAGSENFEIFTAINTMSESLSNLSYQFGIDKFAQRYCRKVTNGEIGCTLSHLAVYQKILLDDEISPQDYCLVCEDDALFESNFQQHLNAILQQNIDADIILLGQSKIDSFNHFELELNYPTTFSFLRKPIANSDYRYSYPYRNYFAGTVAYLIKKSAILKIPNILPYWLADDFILFEQQFGFSILVIRPLLVIENPKLISNLSASRQDLANNLCRKMMKYPFKKLLAVKRNWGK